MTTPVLDPSDPEVLTNVCWCDVKTALARGLCEYIKEHVEIQPSGGRVQNKLKKVVNMYAEPEVLSDYPSATVMFGGDGEYDQGSLETIPIDRDQCVVVLSSFTQDLILEVWCTTPTERALFTNAVEEKLDPTDWMCGLRLTLDHYYGVRATYLIKSVEFADDGEQNVRRYRIARFIITGTAPRLRLVTNQPLDPRAVSTVTTSTDMESDQE